MLLPLFIKRKNRKYSLLLFLLLIPLFILYVLPYCATKYQQSHPSSNAINILSLQKQPIYNIVQKNSVVQPEEERFLAYLPHSGLSNQRIELANALLLAYMLKRTLIVPPAFLGNVFGWMSRDLLAERLEWLTTPKNFKQLCQLPTPGKLESYVQRSKCHGHRHIGVLSWTELHDFTLLDPLIKVKFQSIVSLPRIKHDYNLTDNDIFIHRDAQLYDWRFYENKSQALDLLQNKLNYFDSFSGRRYYKVLLPHHFQRRQEKLLYLGGIFGSTRFNLINPKHKAVQAQIAHTLNYRLDTSLGETVKSIVRYLGGKGSFMSLHFRTGDRPFKSEIGVNLDNFVRNMTFIANRSPKRAKNDKRNCVNVTPFTSSQEEDEWALQNVLENYHGSEEEGEKEENSALWAAGKQVKVYVATDHRDPKGKRSELLPWFEQFPCTTTLSDVPGHLFSPLNKLRDMTSPHKSLRGLLIPIVDAMVAAHAKHILTTPRSTFSKYIGELHRAWLDENDTKGDYGLISADIDNEKKN